MQPTTEPRDDQPPKLPWRRWPRVTFELDPEYWTVPIVVAAVAVGVGLGVLFGFVWI